MNSEPNRRSRCHGADQPARRASARDRFPRWLKFVLVLAWSISAANDLSLWAAATNSPLPVLREIRPILDLPELEAKRRFPVDVEAVVTLRHEGFGLLFVQDQTAGIFVNGLNPTLPLNVGRKLRIKGFTEAGLYSPIIDGAQAEDRGLAVLPPAQRVALGDIVSGSLDSQLVDLEGIVETQENLGGEMELEIASGKNRCVAWVLNSPEQTSADLVDARVRIEGVAGAHFSPEHRLLGFQVYVSGLSNVVVVRKSPDAFTGPVRTANDLLNYPKLGAGQHRVRVQGVVTMHWPGHLLFIKDSTGGIALETKSKTPLLPGDRVDAVGFPVPAPDGSRLRAAVVHSIGRAAPIAPVVVSGSPPWKGIAPYELVQMEGQLLERTEPKQAQAAFLFLSQERLVRALSASTNFVERLDRIAPGSRVRLTGVWEPESRQEDNPAPPALWIGGLADLQELGGPQVSSSSSWRWRTGEALAALVLAGGAVLWFRQRTRKLIEQYQHEAESELQHHMEERERIGQDLHDNIIQSIYAVGLGLEDCRRLVRSASPETEGRLSTAIGALNSVIHDVRQFIGGLEPKVLSGHELKTALKSLALTTGDSSGQFLVQVDPAASRHLTPQQATHLLNIAKEAMSNSLRHAKARQTVVAICLAQGQVRLEIADDGVGFDSTRPVVGNGLRNIASRARELGARLDVISSAQEGTRIVVNLPPRE
jgi:signal transduction histidine kinase